MKVPAGRAEPHDDLGAFLRARRTSRGLTQAELARQIGVAPETVCRWERGKVRPASRRRSTLARALTTALRPAPVQPTRRRVPPQRVAIIAAGLAQVVLSLRAFD